MSDFLGKTINGTVSHYSEKYLSEQHDPKVLMKLLDDLISLKEVDSIRWEQYTPYFNDGDACYFSVGEARVKFVEYDEEEDDEGDYGDGYLGDYELREDLEIYNRLIAINKEIDHHEVVLHKAFGDPAEITYDGESFTVEHYYHD